MQSLVKSEIPVYLRVLEKFERGLIRLLALVPELKKHAHVEVASSHQKVIVLGDQTICIGSLNWLSSAQSEKDPYANVELSIVLQWPKEESIIRTNYRS